MNDNNELSGLQNSIDRKIIQNKAADILPRVFGSKLELSDEQVQKIDALRESAPQLSLEAVYRQVTKGAFGYREYTESSKLDNEPHCELVTDESMLLCNELIELYESIQAIQKGYDKNTGEQIDMQIREKIDVIRIKKKLILDAYKELGSIESKSEFDNDFGRGEEVYSLDYLEITHNEAAGLGRLTSYMLGTTDKILKKYTKITSKK